MANVFRHHKRLSIRCICEGIQGMAKQTREFGRGLEGETVAGLMRNRRMAEYGIFRKIIKAPGLLVIMIDTLDHGAALLSRHLLRLMINR